MQAAAGEPGAISGKEAHGCVQGDPSLTRQARLPMAKMPPADGQHVALRLRRKQISGQAQHVGRGKVMTGEADRRFGGFDAAPREVLAALGGRVGENHDAVPRGHLGMLHRQLVIAVDRHAGEGQVLDGLGQGRSQAVVRRPGLP